MNFTNSAIEKVKQEVNKYFDEYIIHKSSFKTYEQCWEDMAKHFNIEETWCKQLINAYLDVESYEGARDRTYEKYIADTKGVISYENTLSRTSDLAKHARTYFQITSQNTVLQILKSRYYDSLNQLNIEEITLEKLQEMAEFKIDIANLNNNLLKFIYNLYIKNKEKENVLKVTIEKTKLLTQNVKDLDAKYNSSIFHSNYALENFNSIYLEFIREIDFYVEKYKLKKEIVPKKQIRPYIKVYKFREKCINIFHQIKPKSKKIKMALLTEEELPMPKYDWQPLQIQNLENDKLLDNDSNIKLDENDKQILMQEIGIASLPTIIVQLSEKEKSIDKEMEIVLSHLESIETIIKERFQKYKERINEVGGQLNDFLNNKSIDSDYVEGIYIDIKKQFKKIISHVSYFKRHKLKKDILDFEKQKDELITAYREDIGDYFKVEEIHDFNEEKERYINDLKEIRCSLKYFSSHFEQTLNQQLLPRHRRTV